MIYNYFFRLFSLTSLLIVVMHTGFIFQMKPLYAIDWPMWKADATRSGTTKEQLPDNLSLIWSRELPEKQIAWPNEPRLQFDAAHEPIVSGNRLFLAFAEDGSIRSYDIQTGEEKWTFYTNGPIRFSPVVYQNHVIAGSDDGYLYCLNVENGKLEWKVSGAPRNHNKHFHLGNQKLISFWPVRGGPVIENGIVYFGAGIWPSMGSFIHAVDIESGKIVWTNNKSHDLKNIRLDHNIKRDVGISPQGYLLMTGKTLLVPNGRSMPAGFDRTDGSFLFYVQGYRNGDSRVITSNQLALVGETGAISIHDGREIGSRWKSAGKNAPKAADYSKVELFEGPLFPYHSVPGCSFRSAIDQGISYGIHEGTLHAYDLKKNNIVLQETEFHQRNLKTSKWKIPEKWDFEIKIKDKTNLSKNINHITIKAGNQLITHLGPELVAIEIPETQEKSPRIVWHKTLDNDVKSIVASNEKLFVTTKNRIFVFGQSDQKTPPLVYSSEKTNKENNPSHSLNFNAKDILQQTNKTKGYVFILGLDSGELVDDFIQNSEMNVIVMDSDAAKINQFRIKYHFHNTHNRRFQGFVMNPEEMIFPPYFANLITSELSSPKVFSGKLIKKLYQSVRPYGGAICLKSKNSSEVITLMKEVQSYSLPKAELKNNGDWISMTRTGPLEGSSDWTHETGDSARSYYSEDELVKSPLGILWYGDGPGYGFYKKKDYAHGVKPQVAGGKLFALQVFSNTLFAIDIYTGWQLWSKKVPPSARYASFSNHVYLASGKQCEILDAETGEILNTYQFDLPELSDIETSATDIRVDQNIILIGIRKNKENAISKGRWDNHILIAIDQTTGKQVWKREAEQRFNTAALAMGDGIVFCIDSPSYITLEKLKRRGKKSDSFKTSLYAIDAGSGDVLWTKQLENPAAKINSLHFMGLRIKDDWLEYSKQKKLLIAGRGNEFFAVQGDTGKELWKNKQLGQQPLILKEETFFNQAGHKFDILTGERLSNIKFFERGGCNYAVGGKHLLFLRNYCATFVDPKTGDQQGIKNLRTGCSNSFVAANGLLTMPCFSSGCICNYPLQTSFSMFHLQEMDEWKDLKDKE